MHTSEHDACRPVHCWYSTHTHTHKRVEGQFPEQWGKLVPTILYFVAAWDDGGGDADQDQNSAWRSRQTL